MLAKKIISICLCAAVLSSQGMTVLAASHDDKVNLVSIVPFFVYINQANCTLSITKGVATINSYVSKTTSAIRLELTVTLQKNSNGNWANVRSWSTTSTSSLASISKTYTVLSGTYRAVANYSATGQNGTETGITYSNTVTY